MGHQNQTVVAAKPRGGTCKLCQHKCETMHGLHIHLNTVHQMDWRKLDPSEYMVEAPERPELTKEPADHGTRSAASISQRLRAINTNAVVGWVCPGCKTCHSPQVLHCTCNRVLATVGG